MNREIKSRGKRLDNGEWVFGYYVKYEHMGVIKHYIVTSWAQIYVNSHQVIPETVGQFTGLRDKNGKEIYEGDQFIATVCQSPIGISSAHNIFYHVPQIFTVEYRHGKFVGVNYDEVIEYSDRKFYGNNWVDINESFNTIGNIHDQKAEVDHVNQVL